MKLKFGAPKINVKPKGEIGIPKVRTNKGFQSFTRKKSIPKIGSKMPGLTGNLKF